MAPNVPITCAAHLVVGVERAINIVVRDVTKTSAHALLLTRPQQDPTESADQIMVEQNVPMTCAAHRMVFVELDMHIVGFFVKKVTAIAVSKMTRPWDQGRRS